MNGGDLGDEGLEKGIFQEETSMYKGLLVGKRRSIFRERSVHLEQNKSNEEGTETKLEREVAARS